jgi:mono/diheme cytochrome c family protein
MSIRPFCLVALLASAASGCLGSALNGSGDGGTGGNGGPSSIGGADMAPDIKAMFLANVAPIIQPACGGCHGVPDGAGPSFMLPTPDLLSNLLQYPGIVANPPANSRLYAKGAHEGPALTPTQAPIILDWITAYDATLVSDAGAPKPQVTPFAPSLTALNTIDLSVLDSTLAGQKLTFMAKMVGTSLQLSAITVDAAASSGVHLTHPLFVVWDPNLIAHPDPVDSFSGLDETVFAGTTSPLGPGLVILPSFATGSLLSVGFNSIEAKAGGADGGTTVSGCKALAMFVANVKPLLQTNCNSCHTGGAPTAGLAFDATPDATLCANALSEINTTTPANSNMLKKPDPSANGDASHPKKINPFTAYQTAVTNWINAEK